MAHSHCHTHQGVSPRGSRLRRVFPEPGALAGRVGRREPAGSVALAGGYRLAAGQGPSVWHTPSPRGRRLHSPVCRACCSFSKATSWDRLSSWLLSSSNIFGLTTSKSEGSGNDHKCEKGHGKGWGRDWGGPYLSQPQWDKGKRLPSTSYLRILSLSVPADGHLSNCS